MDELITSVKNYINPQPQTVTEICTAYVKNNPTTVLKGVAIGAVGLYTLPIVVGVVGWLPYAGAAYYLYTNTQTAQKAYDVYQWGKSFVV